MRSGVTLMLLQRLLEQGHKLGLGVYSNSQLICDTVENELGLPCTLVELKPDKERKTVNTKLLILDDVEKYFDHKPKPKELSKLFKKTPQYWDLYNTVERPKLP
jgi:hypothetical protein